MFNMYTKLATALGAFALLFSTGAWGQCAEGEVAVAYNLITAGSWPSEISWQLNDAAWQQPVSRRWCLLDGAVKLALVLGSR